MEQKYGIGTTLCVAACAGQAWREKKPVWDSLRCFKCGICWLACPDAAVRPVDQGFYDSDPETSATRISDRLAVRFRPVMSQRCDLHDVGGKSTR